MRAFRFVLGLAAAAFGTLGMGAAAVPFPPDLFLLFVAGSARGGTIYRAMTAGVAAGLVEDLLRTPPRLLGLHAFSKVLLGYLLAAAAARFVVEKPYAVGGLLAGAVVIESVTLAALLSVFRGEAFALASPTALVARAVTTGLAGAGLRALIGFPWKARWAARRRRRLA